MRVTQSKSKKHANKVAKYYRGKYKNVQVKRNKTEKTWRVYAYKYVGWKRKYRKKKK